MADYIGCDDRKKSQVLIGVGEGGPLWMIPGDTLLFFYDGSIAIFDPAMGVMKYVDS